MLVRVFLVLDLVGLCMLCLIDYLWCLDVVFGGIDVSWLF